jgi:hypothetical protein
MSDLTMMNARGSDARRTGSIVVGGAQWFTPVEDTSSFDRLECRETSVSGDSGFD